MRERVWTFIAVVFVFIFVMYMAACEIVKESDTDDRSVRNNCVMEMPDGTRLYCDSEVHKDMSSDDSGTSIDIPVK